MKNKDKGFIRGVGYSIATLESIYFIQQAGQLLNESGFKLQDFIDADVAEYDLEKIKKVFEEELNK